MKEATAAARARLARHMEARRPSVVLADVGSAQGVVLHGLRHNQGSEGANRMSGVIQEPCDEVRDQYRLRLERANRLIESLQAENELMAAEIGDWINNPRNPEEKGADVFRRLTREVLRIHAESKLQAERIEELEENQIHHLEMLDGAVSELRRLGIEADGYGSEENLVTATRKVVDGMEKLKQENATLREALEALGESK